MNARIITLAGLLIAQIALSAYLFSNGHGNEEGRPERLLDIADASQIDGLGITDEDGRSLALRKGPNGWTLPGTDDLPADAARVDDLVRRLTGLERGWPVARTAEAAEHFKVTPEDFVRRIDLMHGEERLARLYLGTSPALRRIHARIDGDERIHAVALSAYEIEAKPDAWLDKSLLAIAEGTEIESIRLAGLHLLRRNGALVVDDLAGDEKMRAPAVDDLVDRLRHLTVVGLADDVKLKEDDEPLTLEISLAGGERRHYRFQAIDEDTDYRLEVDGRRHRFRVAAPLVDALRGFDRDRLVEKTGHPPEASQKSKKP